MRWECSKRIVGKIPLSETMMMNEEATDWLDLPFDLLAQICDKVISFSLTDCVRFGCICVQWRSFFIENYKQIKLSNLPVLLIPSLDHHHHSSYKKVKKKKRANNQYVVITSKYYDPKDIWRGLDYEQRHHSTRSFYSLFEGKVYDFQLPVPSYMNCRGSSHGWLLLVEECRDGTYPVHLFNPFSSDQKNNKINLPPPLTPIYEHFDSYNLSKVIFSRNPSMSYVDEEKLVVFCLTVFYDIEFCRPGEGAWTRLPAPSVYSPVVDLIFYKGQCWGILETGSAVVFDITPEPKFTIVVDPHPDDYLFPPIRYLVESAGDLFHVGRNLDWPRSAESYSIVGFQVFKLDPTTMQWIKTNTLDGCMFFLGENACMSLSVVDNFPEWCKPNSIYLTDDYHESHCARPWRGRRGPHGIGVLNLESGSFEPLYTMESKSILPAPPIMPTPIWIQPKP